MAEKLCSWSHFFPLSPSFNYLEENKSLKALQLVLFKEAGGQFFGCKQGLFGKSNGQRIVDQRPGCPFALGTSQANRLSTEWASLPAAAVHGVK